MKTKILFIALISFILLSIKSNGQTNTTQTLDDKYPYYSIFYDKEKITEQQYLTFNETKRIELFEKYKTEIEEDEFESDVTQDNADKAAKEYNDAANRLIIDTLRKK